MREIALKALRNDRWFMAALLLATTSELVVRQIYHQFGTELTRGVLVAATASMLAAFSCGLPRLPGRDAQALGSRVLALGAITVYSHIVIWPAIAAHLEGVGWVSISVAAAACALALLRVPNAVWMRASMGLAVAALAFVWSQPLIAFSTAPSVTWPPENHGDSVSREKDVRPTATLVLLFDELNAREAPRFEAELRRHGLAVASKPLEAVDLNTHQVIPAMFVGGRFHDAKPCSTTAICAGSRVLDFARVTVSRSDIDVVGFYHPYCSIVGLRTCQRVAMRTFLTEIDRWRCALWRRTGWSGSLSPRACGNIHGRVWESVRTDVIAAVKQAPTLRLGGMLFAHLPLPHPPGRQGTLTLAADYRDNVDRASALLGELIESIDRAGLAPQVIIFSDHPLRQKHWCEGFVQYAAQNCVFDESIEDTQVPLILAARADTQLPPLQDIVNNSQVFSMVGAWPLRR